MTADVLIIDDEADIRELVADILIDEGYEARGAAHADQAFQQIALRRPSLVLLDIWLEGSRLDGLEILSQLVRDHPDVPVIMMSGHGTIETAVQAIKDGAYDFIQKPFETDRLLVAVARAIEAARLKQENAELRLRAGPSANLVGASTAIQQVRTAVDRVAPTNSRVLIQGPPGAGKEVVARLLHAQSRRANGPFLVLNAASMAPDRIEDELFGVERDGDISIGVLERAHGGTLFVDEIAEMPSETQAKVLRVLVDQAFHRVGGDTRVKVDVRIVSATVVDLRQVIADGRFREDLYHRLAVVPIDVPGLRERLEDVPLLIEFFLDELSNAAGLPSRTLSADAVAALQSYDWPGNVRQLKNLIERLLIVGPAQGDSPIEAQHLPQEFRDAASGTLRADRASEIMTLPLREAREVFEREYLSAQIARFGGNVSRTASFVGMERSALHRKLKLLGIGSSERA